MRALGSGTERSFTYHQFDAALRIRIRTTDLLGRFFREFRAKANEIGALPNEAFCLTVFSLVVGRYRAKHNRDEITASRGENHTRLTMAQQIGEKK